MKKILYCLMVVGLVATMTVAFVNKSEAAACYTVFYDWGCDGSFGEALFAMRDDGTWVSNDANSGYWYLVSGKIIMFQSLVGCSAHWSGSNKYGTYECTDGAPPFGEINCYGLKKAKLIECVGLFSPDSEPAGEVESDPTVETSARPAR